MKKETIYEGKIFLKIIEDNNTVKPSVEIVFDEITDHANYLIPALYDLLKEVHCRYSIVSNLKKV